MPRLLSWYSQTFVLSGILEDGALLLKNVGILCVAYDF